MKFLNQIYNSLSCSTSPLCRDPAHSLPTPKASSSSSFMEARHNKPIREPSTSNSEKQPNSPPQVSLLVVLLCIARVQMFFSTKNMLIHLIPFCAPHTLVSLKQITANPHLLTSLFSSLQFNQNSIFNPMLDMGSTRALVLLVSVLCD